MSPIFRPTAELSSGSTELSHAGLSAGAERQLTSSADISKAHQFFTPGAESHAIASAAAAPVMPGAEAAMAMPMVPGAAEPISPLIQLIMRMPGQLGLLSSFFEALGNFFMPDLSAIGFDPAMFGDPNLIGAGHFMIDPSLLPDGAPILEDGGFEKRTAAMSSTRPNLMQHSEMSRFGDQLKVSGGVDAKNLRFEGGQLDLDKPGNLLSGPAMSDSGIGNHLAGTQRIFSDRFQGSLFTRPGMNSNMLASSGTTVTPAANSLNVGGSAFGAQPESLSAAGQPGDFGGVAPANGGFDAGYGNSNLLATNSADTFRPTLGGQSGDHAESYLHQTPADVSAHNTNAHAASNASPLKGLKAKELSLDSFKPGADAAKLDHSAANHATTKLDNSAANKLANAKPSAANARSSAAPAASAAKPAAHSAHSNTKLTDASSAKAGYRSLLEKTPGQDAARLDTSKDVSQVADNSAIASDLKPSSYTIRAGDCLWNIAKNQLGSAMKWQDVYNMNQDVLGANPDMIHTGVTIKLPGGADQIANAGSEATKYVVKPGDNLWNIAKDQMHDATKWGDIYKANTDVIGSIARLITPGQELSIPGADQNAVVADAGPAAAGGDQLAQAAPTADAPMLSAQAPQTNFGVPATMDSAAPAAPAMEMTRTATMEQTPMSMQQAPATVQPAPVMQQVNVMQQAPVVQQAPAFQPGTMQQLIPTLQTGPGAAIPAPSVHVGPGAASAATATTTPLNPALAIQSGVVNSSLGSDIAAFLSQRK